MSISTPHSLSPLPLILSMSFFYLFLSSIREFFFGVNIYPSLPLAFTANLINEFLHLFHFPNMLYANIRNTKILQTIPPQNRYSFNPSYLKKLFLLSSSSRTFCFITLVSVSDCFSRAFVALCTASIFACNAFLTSWTVFSLTSSFKLPISPDIAS